MTTMTAAAPMADDVPMSGVPTSGVPMGDAPAACVSVRSAFAIEVPDALLERVRRGERGAFEQLYRRFERPVHTLAVRMLADARGDGRDDAADVLQETMLKVFRRIHEFRNDGAPFWGWLRQIAVNEALMRLRSRRRLDSEVGLDDGNAIEDPAPPPAAAADAAQLQRALAELPAATRSILWLYHAEGYTHDEIGALMQRTASFSKSQLARGTRRLRERLGPDARGPNREVSDVR
jgi:RNA polymerase sigma factor (sigma-70 family)